VDQIQKLRDLKLASQYIPKGMAEEILAFTKLREKALSDELCPIFLFIGFLMVIIAMGFLVDFLYS